MKKSRYAQFGFKAVFSDIDEIARFIDLEVDGQIVAIPTGIAGMLRIIKNLIVDRNYDIESSKLCRRSESLGRHRRPTGIL